MGSEGQAAAHESVPLDKALKLLQLSDELQKIVFYPDQEILNRIVFGASELLESESCGIFLKTGPETYTLEADYSEKYKYRTTKSLSVRLHKELGGGLTGYIAAMGEIVNLHGKELREHPYRLRNSPPPEHLVSGCESLLSIPLKDRKGRLLGLLNAH